MLLSAEAVNNVDPVEWQAEPLVQWSFGLEFPAKVSQAEDAEQIRLERRKECPPGCQERHWERTSSWMSEAQKALTLL